MGENMRKIAQNHQNFTVKKNVTFLFLVGLGWNSNSILTLLKTSFLWIFKAVAPKKKLRFFTRFQYFCDALYKDFGFAKNIVILI